MAQEQHRRTRFLYSDPRVYRTLGNAAAQIQKIRTGHPDAEGQRIIVHSPNADTIKSAPPT